MEPPFIKTHSYSLTSPISNNKITNTLKVALLFMDQNTKIKTRQEILLKIGVPKKRAKKTGELAALFTALNWNKIIKYDKKTKHHVAGEDYLKYLLYAQDFICKNNLQRRHKKEYLKILTRTSPSTHFILED